MKYHRVVVLLILAINLLIFLDLVYAQEKCVAPDLSKDRIREIVVEERARRKDLPEAFPKYRWTVSKRGCHYIYSETGFPEAPEFFQTFRLNQFGVIVEVITGGLRLDLKCPDEVFTDSEIVEIIKKARENRRDLPLPFPKYESSILRKNCLYLYLEHKSPVRLSGTNVFLIDPFGELMEFAYFKP